MVASKNIAENGLLSALPAAGDDEEPHAVRAPRQSAKVTAARETSWRGVRIGGAVYADGAVG